jgi:hypothetical protein
MADVDPDFAFRDRIRFFVRRHQLFSEKQLSAISRQLPALDQNLKTIH